MSWDKLEIEIHQESFRQRNEILSGKKGNDSMNLQKMSKADLQRLQNEIANEIKKREEMEAQKVADEFLAVWKKMERMGFKLRTEEIITMDGYGKKVFNLNVEVNGKLVEIYQ